MKINISFMRFQDFREILPKLAEQLEIEQAVNGSKNFVEGEPFVYHLTRGGNVERQALIDNPNYRKKWGMPMEKSGSRKKNIRSDYARFISRKKLQTEQKKLCEGCSKDA